MFWINDTFYKPGGPVFCTFIHFYVYSALCKPDPSPLPHFPHHSPVFLGGEAPIHFFDFQEASALDWAAENNALYVALEHRFYGQSNPKPDLSVASLRYLSSQQALADAAVFVDTMKAADPRFGGQWLVLGCSYSGALSAWFRTKYPHLVVGSIAPSAPVWAEWDFVQFFDNFIQQAPASCVSAAQSATQKMTTLLSTSTGRRQLAAAFNACEPFDSDVDIFNFKYTVVTFLTTTAQVRLLLVRCASGTIATNVSKQWENPGPVAPNGWQMTQACQMMTSSNDYVSNWGRAFIKLQATPNVCRHATHQNLPLNNLTYEIRYSNAHHSNSPRFWIPFESPMSAT